MFTPKDLQRLTDINSFLSLSDRDFEWCCKFLLEKAGYGKAFVTKKGPKGGDGGIDLDIYSADKKLIAGGQCKLWKGRFNGLMKPVRELCGSMKIKGVSRGVFIVTVEATPEEKREAQMMNIEMIDVHALLELVKRCVKDVSHATPAPIITLTAGKLEKVEEKSADHKIAKIIFAVIGFLLMALGYTFIGVVVLIVLFFSLLSLGLSESGSNYQQRLYYRKRYRRPRKKYYRHRRKRSYSYGF